MKTLSLTLPRARDRCQSRRRCRPGLSPEITARPRQLARIVSTGSTKPQAQRDAAALIPSCQILVETDAPFLTPHPFRGRPNEPYCAAYTLRALAQLRKVDPAELAAEVDATAERVFDLRGTTPREVGGSER